MKVSYLMPSWNSELYMAEAISSVLVALGPEDELIIQDGGSLDRTQSIVESFSDARIKFVSEKDNGQADALNRALDRATGDWIAWVNSDDLLLHSGRDAVALAMEREPDCGYIYGEYATVDEKGKNIRSFQPRQITLNDLLFGSQRPFSGAILIRREFLVSVGKFSNVFHYCMDYELYLRIWSSGVRGIYLPVQMGVLRLHDQTKTSGVPWKFVREARIARKPYLRSPWDLVRSYVQTLKHGLTVATTSLRSSEIYLKIRHGYTN